MTAPRPTAAKPALHGRTVVITRPSGTASSLAREVRRRGGSPLLLPGLSLHGADRPTEAAAALDAALGDDLLIFTSPAAVRFAARLVSLRTRATVFAVGQGTARALRRHGVQAPLAPALRQDSEGLLEHPLLAEPRGLRVALIGAPGGRGVLRATLAERGVHLREVHVYQRGMPRWQARHFRALEQLPGDACVLLSSAEALGNLQQGLPARAWAQLLAADAVASSERLAEAARSAGFSRVRLAASALSADLLEAAAR